MKLKSAFRNVFRRRGVESELDRELHATLDSLIEEKVRAGASMTEARRLAIIELGGIDQVKESVRSVRAGSGFDRLSRQIGFALRLLPKSPVFTLVVAITLALGIGANAAMFTMVHAVLLQPLPYKDPGKLVLLSAANDPKGFSGMPIPAGAYFDFRKDPNAFSDLAVFSDTVLAVSLNNETISVSGARATSNLFDLLGVSPSVGRTFSRAEDSPGGEKVVVLSHGFWQRNFGGRSIAEQSIVIEGAPYTIIGVMPPEFAFPSKSADLWIPLQLNESDPQWGRWFLKGLGRMRSGTTPSSTTSSLALGAQRFAKDLPFEGTWRFEVKELTEEVVGEYRLALRFLFAAVGLVLLIACANVSSLVFARTHARRKELAMRAALGASRVRIVCDLLIENCVLAVLGGLAGLASAYWAVAFLKGLLPPAFPRLDEIHINSSVLLFSAIVSLGTGIISGVVPAIRSSRVQLLDAMKGGGSDPQSRLIGGATMVAVEVSLCLLVVVAAGLFVRSFQRLMEVPLGFDPSVVSIPVNLPATRYRPLQQRVVFGHELLRRFESDASARVAALSTSLPTRGTQMMESSFIIDGTTGPTTIEHSLGIDSVSSDYFQVVGIPLIQGRVFNDGDAASSGKVVIVNETMARRFPNGQAVGRRLQSSDDVSWYTVVGIVGDVKQYGLEEQTPMLAYLPFDQEPSLRFQLVLRPQSGVESAAALMKSRIREIDPALPMGDIAVLQKLLADSTAGRRFNAMLMSGFGLLAIILAAAGVYGVADFAAARRKKEVGVRVALGAGSPEVYKLLLGRTLTATIIGMAIGMVAAIAAKNYFKSMVFGISPVDPIALTAGTAVVLFVAFLAAYIPARRALNADPIRVLRSE